MKKKILFVVSLLFGLMMINSGLNKFFNYMPMPEEMPAGAMELFTAFMSIKWLMPLVAIAEIVGGALIITNRFRALGALILFPVMVGILLTHIVNVPDGLPMALILFAILIWIMIENREKYMGLVAR
jgi:uncharacterized membrane protein YphA (DoxX/SURF4 family)